MRRLMEKRWMIGFDLVSVGIDLLWLIAVFRDHLLSVELIMLHETGNGGTKGAGENSDRTAAGEAFLYLTVWSISLHFFFHFFSFWGVVGNSWAIFQVAAVTFCPALTLASLVTVPYYLLKASMWIVGWLGGSISGQSSAGSIDDINAETRLPGWANFWCHALSTAILLSHFFYRPTLLKALWRYRVLVSEGPQSEQRLDWGGVPGAKEVPLTIAMAIQRGLEGIEGGEEREHRHPATLAEQAVMRAHRSNVKFSKSHREASSSSSSSSPTTTATTIAPSSSKAQAEVRHSSSFIGRLRQWQVDALERLRWSEWMTRGRVGGPLSASTQRLVIPPLLDPSASSSSSAFLSSPNASTLQHHFLNGYQQQQQHLRVDEDDEHEDILICNNHPIGERDDEDNIINDDYDDAFDDDDKSSTLSSNLSHHCYPFPPPPPRSTGADSPPPEDDDLSSRCSHLSVLTQSCRHSKQVINRVKHSLLTYLPEAISGGVSLAYLATIAINRYHHGTRRWPYPFLTALEHKTSHSWGLWGIIACTMITNCLLTMLWHSSAIKVAKFRSFSQPSRSFSRDSQGEVDDGFGDANTPSTTRYHHHEQLTHSAVATARAAGVIPLNCSFNAAIRDHSTSQEAITS